MKYINIEKHRAFIDSLEGEKGLPEEIRRFRLIKLGDDKKLHRSSEGEWVRYQDHLDAIEILESRQIPDLKEKVKAFGRDAMDAVETYRDAKWGGEHLDERERKAYKAFRALCEPEKDSKSINSFRG